MVISLLSVAGQFLSSDCWCRISLLVYDVSLGWLTRHGLATLGRTGC